MNADVSYNCDVTVPRVHIAIHRLVSVKNFKGGSFPIVFSKLSLFFSRINRTFASPED